jgi:hypothetical protein
VPLAGTTSADETYPCTTSSMIRCCVRRSADLPGIGDWPLPRIRGRAQTLPYLCCPTSAKPKSRTGRLRRRASSGGSGWPHCVSWPLALVGCCPQSHTAHVTSDRLTFVHGREAGGRTGRHQDTGVVSGRVTILGAHAPASSCYWLAAKHPPDTTCGTDRRGGCRAERVGLATGNGSPSADARIG